MLKLAVSNTIDFPVILHLLDGKGKRTFAFNLVGDRLDTEQLNKEVGEKAEDPTLTIGEFLHRHIQGWHGQKLVLGEDDKPAEFAKDSFQLMLDQPGVTQIVFVSYQKALFASDGDVGRRKN